MNTNFLLPVLLYIIFIAFYKNIRIINETFSNKKYTIKKSNINGQGVIATEDIPAKQKIDIAFYEINKNGIKHANITPHFGRYINHCLNSNTHLEKEDGTNKYWLVASKNIKKEQEIVANYNNTPNYISKPGKDFISYCS